MQEKSSSEVPFNQSGKTKHKQPQQSVKSQGLQEKQFLILKSSENQKESPNSEEKQTTHSKEVALGKSQVDTNILMLQKIISSNQDFMHLQSEQCASFKQQLLAKTSEFNQINQKYKNLKEAVSEINGIHRKSEDKNSRSSGTVYDENHQINKFDVLELYESKVSDIQKELISTKVSLAISMEQNLELRTRVEELEARVSILQQREQQSDSLSSRKSSYSKQTDTELTEPTKQNYVELGYVNNVEPMQIHEVYALRKTPSKDANEQQSVMYRVWEQNLHHFDTLTERDKFTTEKVLQCFESWNPSIRSLIKKTPFGIPHCYRSKLWPILCGDMQAISNGLTIELVQQIKTGCVSERVMKQIDKDIVRSFNGNGSMKNLKQIYKLDVDENEPISPRKHSSIEGSPEKINSKDVHFSSPIHDHENSLSADNKRTDPLCPTQPQFSLTEEVTEVLEMFSLHRPDISYVQGMTYPSIILTLVVGKINAFRILSNLLLSNKFFFKLITFEPHFIGLVCRIFEKLLEDCSSSLYKHIRHQHQIRSEIFLVDWFFTFFCRGISPTITMKIWDLMLVEGGNTRSSTRGEQLHEFVMFKTALSIMCLLEETLLMANYEECIQAIREFYKKIDEHDLIKMVYSEKLLTRDKFLKVKAKCFKEASKTT